MGCVLLTKSLYHNVMTCFVAPSPSGRQGSSCQIRDVVDIVYDLQLFCSFHVNYTKLGEEVCETGKVLDSCP